MKYLISHSTKYDYGDVVPECFNIVRLSPRSLETQTCNRHEMAISPEPGLRTQRTDFFGNGVEQFSIHVPHSSLLVEVFNEVEVFSRELAGDVPARDGRLLGQNSWRQSTVENLGADLVALPLVNDSNHVRASDAFAEYASESFEGERPMFEAAMELTSRIFEDFKFAPGTTTVSTPVEQVFEKRAGVCQDFAHFQIACLRSLGIPARYMSGYLRTIPPPGKERLVGADASHAWVAVYCGVDGWLEFDPTNNVVPNTDHIAIGWGRDYADVCPIQGVFTGGGETVMRVSVDVAPRD
jgi:transglutaminase-like putative cysteine protease